MSRKIFITIGVLLNLVQLILPFWAWATELNIGSGKNSNPFGVWGFLSYFFLLGAYFAIVAFIYLINDMCPLSWWIASPNKRIYHAELGTLYAEISQIDNLRGKKEMRIWKQYWLFSKKIAQIDYIDNKELLIQCTKTVLDEYHSKRQEKKKSKSKSGAFYEWDGYVDTQSKRDDKLNKILD